LPDCFDRHTVNPANLGGTVKYSRFLGLSCALAAAWVPAIAQAQAVPEGETFFRVPIDDQSLESAENAAWVWMENVASCSTQCGTGARLHSYVCQDAFAYDFLGGGYGAPEPDAECLANAGSKPAGSSEACTTYAGCSYDWVKPAVISTPVAIAPNPVGRLGCGQIHEVFSPFCRRSDGSVLSDADHAYCSDDRPDYDRVAAGDPDALGYDRTVIQTGSCTTSDHQWVTGDWSNWSSDCSPVAARTRTVSCKRKFDGTIVADASCEAGSKPNASETSDRYGACSYTWSTTAWSAFDSSCSTEAERTRSAACIRSDGETVADTECTSRGVAKPSVSETAAQYGSCSYAYTEGSWGEWSSSCDANASRTRSVTCMRSNGDAVAENECASRGILKPATNETSAQYGSCSYGFQTGSWSGWNSSCSSSAARTRSVWCQRSDGTTMSDSECTSRGQVRPDDTEWSQQYGGCSYSTTLGSWSSCTNGTQSRPVTCTRSDGATVDASYCGTSNTQSQSCSSWRMGQYCNGGRIINEVYWGGGRADWVPSGSSGTIRSPDACRAIGGNCFQIQIERADGEQGSDYYGGNDKCLAGSTSVEGVATDSWQAWIYQ